MEPNDCSVLLFPELFEKKGLLIIVVSMDTSCWQLAQHPTQSVRVVRHECEGFAGPGIFTGLVCWLAILVHGLQCVSRLGRAAAAGAGFCPKSGLAKPPTPRLAV